MSRARGSKVFVLAGVDSFQTMDEAVLRLGPSPGLGSASHAAFLQWSSSLWPPSTMSQSASRIAVPMFTAAE
ncbi:hypothetical protein P8C59_007523 [Phyllachora maydis]|uniref:Uncharacterized protein n=1 Tax=Phyllachora maydis TaxID=1825666 RepID=A0AAD9I988_9PEZI|nr:hypothetical protein P8C59_007523 [Phyllachora maydis]